MKKFHLFLGLFFLISIVINQGVEAGSPVPAGLTSAIEHVKKMKRSGASKKDIAAYVTRTVANQITFLNHSAHQKDGSFLVNDEIEKKVKRFNAWHYKNVMNKAYYSNGIWAWENRMGQCNESASVTFHILAMAFESTDEITIARKDVELIVGDHAFVVWGDVKNIPDSFSPDDLLKLDNSYIIDPWGGKSFSTKDLSRFDIYQHGTGVQYGRTQYRFYKKQYDKWLAWCKKNPHEYQLWLHGIPDTLKQMEKEEKGNMEFVLAQHQKEINELKALKKQILRTGGESCDNAKNNLDVAEALQKIIKNYETKIVNHVDQGETFCDEVRKLYQKIIALSAAMEDGETLINTKITLAKDRAANCKTDADGGFVRNNYQAAQEAYSIMIKAKEAALVAFMELKDKLEQIKRINDYLKNEHDYNQWKELIRGHGEFLEDIPQNLDQLDTGIEDAKGFPLKVQALKTKIEASKKYYIQSFPGAEAKFNQLISQVNSIQLYYVIDPASLSDLRQKYQTAQTILDTPTGGNPRLFSGAPPLINCISQKASEKEMDKIDEAFLRGLLVLKTSDYLRDGCKVKAAVQEPPEDSDGSLPQPPAAVTGGSTAGTPAANPGGKSTQGTSSNTMGGLIIVGPANVTTGQGVTYTACDGTGVPYTSGSFSWNILNETVMSLDRSGNPVSGVGFKAGSVTILVHYDGGDIYSGTAWLDVKIKDKENNLFSTSGGEDSEDSENAQGNLSSITKGEQTGTGASLFSIATEENKLKNQCDQLLNNISSALDRGDTKSAQSFTYQAAALSCEIDPGVLAQVENIEKRTKEQREQQLADTAQKEEQQEEECRKIRLDIIAAANQGNVGALQNLAGQSANVGCNNTSYINQLIAKIETKKRQQQQAQQQAQAHAQSPPQQQNQANWMDVFNMITKGVKDVQQGSSKPTRRSSTSSSGSKPLPSSGTIWPPLPPATSSTYIGAKPFGNSGNTSQPQKNKPPKSTKIKDAPYCQGHTLYCKDNGVPVNFGFGSMKTTNSAQDKNRDNFCDICGKRFGNFYEDTVFSKFKGKNRECRTSPW